MIKHLVPVLTTTALCFLPNIAYAQTYTPSNRTPQTDNSIGTIVNPAGANNFNITGGLQRGQHLFHSFTDFSIPTGGAANFTSPQQTQSIITRVTGNLFSDLNGTLNTNGANFLLINPNGVVFGSGVKLDVGRAFVTSTASGVDFVDAQGGNYNFGVNQQGDPLLSIAPDIAFNPARLIMGGSNAGGKGIENYGILQTNNSGQYIGLIGGNVTFDGGNIVAPGGRVDIGGLNSAGTVSIGNKGLVFAGNGLIFGDVSLNNASIDISADRKLAGVNSFFDNTTFSVNGINISAGNVDINTSVLLAGLTKDSRVQTAASGDINIDATGKLTINAGAIVNTIESGAEGQIGNININADSLVGNQLAVISFINQGGKGSGGNINIKIKSNLTIAKYSLIGTSTFGEGDTGQITIDTNGMLLIDDTLIHSEIISTGVGNSKGIKIDAGELELTNASSISSSTFQSALVKDKGNAGDIDIKTKRNLTIANSSIYNDSYGSGNAGKITLDVQGKLIVNSGNINNSIYSRLVDKNANIVANDSFGIINILTPNQEYFSIFLKATGDWPVTIGNTSIGNSQAISIKARELEIKNSNISSETGGEGNAGDIKIGTTGNANITESTISSNIGRYGEGKTGKISIDTGGKLILNNSEIQSIVAGGIGNSQGIDIKASELNLLDNSGVLSQTSGQGNAGDIRITTLGDTILSNSLIYSGSNSLSFSPTATPLSSFFPVPDLKGTKYSAGNIDISSKGLLMDNGDIISASELGQGGNIKLTMSDKLLLRENDGFFSTISTDSGINYRTVVRGDGDALYISKSTGFSNSLSISGSGVNTIKQTSQDSRDNLIKNNKKPSTEYFSGGGNGGNITISSPLIIALPGNNDITANAYQGDGGKVNITSQGLFGIQYRPVGTTFTNDITASSTFGQSGNVNINTPGIDPGKNTGELPAAPNDASNQISQACGASQRENKFYITGRGGLPPNASEPQESDALWQDAREVKNKPAPTASQPPKFAPPAIGWVFQPDGRVRLIAAQTVGGATGTKALCPNK